MIRRTLAHLTRAAAAWLERVDTAYANACNDEDEL